MTLRNKVIPYYPTLNPSASRGCGKIQPVFRNNGIKYRSKNDMSQEEIERLLDKRYAIFDVEGTKIIAISPKRAMQTYIRIQNI